MKTLLNVLLIFSLSCAKQEQHGLVVKVIDGDTFDMKSGNEKIQGTVVWN